MDTLILIRRRLKPALGPVLGVCLVAYFAYHSVYGDHGLFARNHLAEQVEQAQATLETLRHQRIALEHRANLMTPGNVDRDMLDEQVRAMLNYAAPQDVVLYMPTSGR